MAKIVRQRGKVFLASGQSVAGTPRQDKTLVTGKIVVTSFAPGESLSPTDVGLEKIDFIKLVVDEAVGGVSGQPRTAEFDRVSQEFYIFQSGSTVLTNGNNYTISFIAYGDDAREPSLL